MLNGEYCATEGTALEETIAAEDGEGVLPLLRMQKDEASCLTTTGLFREDASSLTDLAHDPPSRSGLTSIRSHPLHSSFRC